MARWRSWCLFFGLSLGAAAAGCTSKNPAATCSQGTCIDPNFPYCDLDGSIGGEPGTCIAVTCTAGEFGKCSGDTAYTCNQFGTGYDQVDCAHGCDEAQSGCRLCEPNQTACTNGTVATCDANGNQTITEQCPLGCFENQPRCRDVDPSNRLGTYFDMVTSPPDVDLSSGGWTIDVGTGVIVRGADSSTIAVPNFLVPSPSGGPAIRVFVVDHLKVGDTIVVAALSGDPPPSNTAIAFLASGPIEISGAMRIYPTVGNNDDVACAGAPGRDTSAQANGACYLIAGGGGGGAVAGAKAGAINDSSMGSHAAGGSLAGMDSLEPLIGGCSGGGFNTMSGPGGGGAIQLTSRSSIAVTGSIFVDGAQGNGDNGQDCSGYVTGGSGAGGILLEAPLVTLDAGSTLSAIGGTGAAGCLNPSQSCGAGGAGGNGITAPMNGADATFTVALPASTIFSSGGGGGGAGRVRINTPTGNYTADSSATRHAVVTTGMLKTR